MKVLRDFFAFWYDFIVGDDWIVAVGVVVAFAATAALTAVGIAAWWLIPVATASLLGVSLWRALP